MIQLSAAALACALLDFTMIIRLLRRYEVDLFSEGEADDMLVEFLSRASFSDIAELQRLGASFNFMVKVGFVLLAAPA